jgi:hypothetical protein
MVELDLKNARPGDKLLTVHGTVLTYIRYEPTAYYPHIVEYENGSRGSRMDNGQVFKNNRLPTDEDVVAIMRKS